MVRNTGRCEGCGATFVLDESDPEDAECLASDLAIHDCELSEWQFLTFTIPEGLV